MTISEWQEVGSLLSMMSTKTGLVKGSICLVHKATQLDTWISIQKILENVFSSDISNNDNCSKFQIRVLYSPRPLPKLESTPQTGGTTPPPNQAQKFWYVEEVHKMTKVLEEGRENKIFVFKF